MHFRETKTLLKYNLSPGEINLARKTDTYFFQQNIYGFYTVILNNPANPCDKPNVGSTAGRHLRCRPAVEPAIGRSFPSEVRRGLDDEREPDCHGLRLLHYRTSGMSSGLVRVKSCHCSTPARCPSATTAPCLVGIHSSPPPPLQGTDAWSVEEDVFI